MQKPSDSLSIRIGKRFEVSANGKLAVIASAIIAGLLLFLLIITAV